jgi:hypothetical protein
MVLQIENLHNEEYSAWLRIVLNIINIGGLTRLPAVARRQSHQTIQNIVIQIMKATGMGTTKSK